MRIRVIMPVIIDQAGRNSNGDLADGVNRRHRCWTVARAWIDAAVEQLFLDLLRIEKLLGNELVFRRP